MRIACPNCSAEYDVPDSLLATGPRLLRCARCKTQFEAAMPAAASSAPIVAPPPPPGESPPPARRPLPASLPEPPRRAVERPQEVPAPVSERPEPGPATLEVEPAAPGERDRPRPTRGLGRHSPIEPPPPHRLPEPEAPRATRGVVLAWVLSFALIGAAAWATYTFHAEITAAWPPAARLYQALGIN